MLSSETEAGPNARFHGEYHATNGAVAALTLYKDNSNAAYTLAASEYLVIESVILVSAASGDAFVFVGDSSTVAAGQYVARGTFAANGGVANAVIRFVGKKGQLVYAQGPNGVLDVIVYGQIRQG